MDSRPEPDADYCVKWEPVDGKEPTKFVTMTVAADRLSRNETPAKRAAVRVDAERQLRDGKTLRTYFAEYSLATP